MTTCDRRSGFTLLEIIVVLAVLGILLGTAVPLASAAIEADRRQEVRAELTEVAAALESFYYENGAFPSSLTATGFIGEHLQPGVSNTTTLDPFGAGQPYLYSVDTSANTATVYSRGENGSDDGIAAEEYKAVCYGAVPGTRKTHARMRVIIEVLANHIEAGGSVLGAWPALSNRLGLGTAYDDDGFGTGLQWTSSTYTLSSAGPDRTFGTADDITL
ncbi:MAG: prepilin-type N-terminal cleavage/methylation domain-containing protein [Planctomycetes bacterium]|nr:prepilin-type N-terminal cleavage/methylation domain-containing protein [Planctomycetota bacterium]